MSGDRLAAQRLGPTDASTSLNAARSPRGRTERVALAVLCCVAGVAAAFACGFFVFVASIERLERAPSEKGDGIVALTGGAERIEDAIGLLAQGYGTRLLISGVNERTGREEIARLTPGQRRLVECCVDLDYRARNTVGNAAEISQWARERGFRSLVVVTSNYHLPRALVELDHVLPSVRKIPYAVVAKPRQPEGWSALALRGRLLASEYAKLVAVWLRTRLPAAARDEPVRASLVAPPGVGR